MPGKSQFACKTWSWTEVEDRHSQVRGGNLQNLLSLKRYFSVSKRKIMLYRCSLKKKLKGNFPAGSLASYWESAKAIDAVLWVRPPQPTESTDLVVMHTSLFTKENFPRFFSFTPPRGTEGTERVCGCLYKAVLATQRGKFSLNSCVCLKRFSYF